MEGGFYMKKWMMVFCVPLWALLLLVGCGGKSTMTGRYLLAENGAALIVTDDGEAITLSDQSRGRDLFDGLESGDRIQITHDGIAESYPGQTGAYTCKLLEDGGVEDIPEETLANLEGLGWDFGRHVHTAADRPPTVEAPVSGCCGNTVTKVTMGGEEHSFWGGDSVTLTDILINLAYDADEVCRCPVEYTVDTEFGDGYGVNLTESFARCAAGQSPLTEAQTETIRNIITRNCGG